MMKRITLLLTVITVIFAACFSFAGCADNSDGGGSDGTASESSLIESGDKNAEIKYNIVLSATDMKLDVGESKVLHASYGNKTLTFESSDNSVATVAADGTVTAKNTDPYATAKMSASDRSALVKQLQADQEQRTQSMIDMVRSVLGQQSSFASATDSCHFA